MYLGNVSEQGGRTFGHRNPEDAPGKGQRGELVARLILTLAFDAAVQSLP